MTDEPVPVASCLICGVLAPLTVWYRATTHGACESCRTAPAALTACQQERDEAQAAYEQAEVSRATNARLLDELYPRLHRMGADLTACRAQGEAMRQLVESWEQQAEFYAGTPMESTYDHCADDLRAALSSTPTEPKS